MLERIWPQPSETTLTRVVGSGVNAGPVNMPERRQFVERFFGVLEENGFHRLPSTVGSNPSDARRDDSKACALRSESHMTIYAN